MTRKIIAASAAGIVVASLAVFLFPIVIFQMEGRYVPAQWLAQTDGRTLEQVEKSLGPPTIDAGAKDMRAWVVREWWGQKRLDAVGGDDRRAPSSFGYTVSIDHYISGGFVYRGEIGRAHPQTWETYPFLGHVPLRAGRAETAVPPVD